MNAQPTDTADSKVEFIDPPSLVEQELAFAIADAQRAGPNDEDDDDDDEV